MTTKVAAYLRVSTSEQESGIESQERAVKQYLKGHGLEATFYRDKLSGKDTKRPGFERMQRDIFSARISTVIVWKLDRLSRAGLREGVNILGDWLEKGVRVVSVQERFDFSGATGQLISAVLFSVASMERESLRENTRRGLANAKAKGVRLGKRPKLFSKDILALTNSGMTLSEAARQLGVSRQAIYNCLKRENISIQMLTTST